VSSTRFFLLAQVNPELLARCPLPGEAGKVVVWRGKKYYLSRQYTTRDKVFIHKIKRKV
jgi:hypothetical protein